MSPAVTDIARSGRRRAKPLWFASEVALLALAAFCPLALGAVHLWAVGVAAFLASVALLLAALACLRGGEPFELPFPAPLFVLATGFIAFQLIPLPPFLLGLLAPATREIFEFVLGPLGAWPAWRPLSLDPSATARELVKALTCLAAFLAAAQLARSRRTRNRLVLGLGLVALSVALIGYGHELADARTLFGLYNFRFAASPFFTTLGNPNHLSALLTLGATALLARILTEPDRKVATLWGFAYLTTGVAVLLSLSRGGIVAFLASQLLLGFAARLRRTRGSEPGPEASRNLLVPAAVVLVLSVAGYLAWEALAAELASADSLDKVKDSKLALWLLFLPLLRDHWLTGVGRGAFEPAFQRVQELAASATFTHPESLPFQWTTELGLPLGLLLLGGCAWSVWRALTRSTQLEPLACAVAVLGLALHDLVDFSLELPGVAVPGAIAFAVAAGHVFPSPRRVGRRLAVAAVPVMAALGLLSLILAMPSQQDDGDALASRLDAVPAEAFARDAAAMARRHPADFFPHLLAAQAFARESPLQADRMLGFAARAMYLRPAHPTAHLLAARALVTSGRRQQARTEFRLAIGHGERGAIGEVAGIFADPADLRAAVPEDEHSVATLLDALIARGQGERAETVGEAALADAGDRLGILVQLGRVAQARKAPDRLRMLAARASKAAPDDPAGLRMEVQALLLEDRATEAMTLLEQTGLVRFPYDPSLALWLAELRLADHDTPGVREALKRLPPTFDAGIRIRALLLEAASLERDGHAGKAIPLVRQAVGVRPEDHGLKWQLATLLERTNRLPEAMATAQGLVGDPGYGAHAEKMIARLKARQKELEEMRRWRETGREP